MSHHILTKEEAWAERDDEVSIPIRDRKKYKFIRRWFMYRNCCTFSTFLLPKFPPEHPYNMVTIGVFEGAQEVWLMQHILQHPQSRLVSIDPWASLARPRRKEMDQSWMDERYAAAQSNLSAWKDQVTLIRGYSQDVLPEAIQQDNLAGIPVGQFDLVIIDGDHTKWPVYKDAINAFKLVRVGGWLLFDDVRNRVEKKDHVKEGLEMFLQAYGDRLVQAWSHRFCECYERTE